VNVIMFQDNDWTYTGIDGTLAKTIVTFDDRTGEIYDADIDINAAENNLTVTDTRVGYDLQSIVTHEAGHFIGMAHSPYPDATMFASYTPGTFDSRKLKADDIAGACAIYPPNRGADCSLMPRGGLGTTCSPADSSSKNGCRAAEGDAGSGLLGAGAVIAVVAIRRRRVAR
jgi:MYXO-CTERM domain-containing protein